MCLPNTSVVQAGSACFWSLHCLQLHPDLIGSLWASRSCQQKAASASRMAGASVLDRAHSGLMSLAPLLEQHGPSGSLLWSSTSMCECGEQPHDNAGLTSWSAALKSSCGLSPLSHALPVSAAQWCMTLFLFNTVTTQQSCKFLQPNLPRKTP